jgi:sulfur-carrier protein adenylyltransferase/sulfurtransferase
MEFSHEEHLRYSRHFLLPEIGREGQNKIKSSRVLLIGAGGLGSAAGFYLAAAGVGTIGIVDFDRVEVTNLHRQILHTTPDIGRKKVESARDTMVALNPNVTVQPFDVRLTSQNASEIFSRYDMIIDGSDNFTTRYLVNDAAVLLDKPIVYGSASRFDGEVSVFGVKHGPCYRCLHPKIPPADAIPNCAEGGIIGVLPGIIGSLQALEAIKLIIGTGDPLIGRVLLFDALQTKFREIILEKDPACAVCGKNPTIREITEINSAALSFPVTAGSEISAHQLRAKIERGEHPFILDVREEHEYHSDNIGGHLIPLNELEKRIQDLDSSTEIIVYCETGVRSATAVGILHQHGFTKVKNLVGGIIAWNNLLRGIVKVE